MVSPIFFGHIFPPKLEAKPRALSWVGQTELQPQCQPLSNSSKILKESSSSLEPLLQDRKKRIKLNKEIYLETTGRKGFSCFKYYPLPKCD